MNQERPHVRGGDHVSIDEILAVKAPSKSGAEHKTCYEEDRKARVFPS